MRTLRRHRPSCSAVRGAGRRRACGVEHDAERLGGGVGGAASAGASAAHPPRPAPDPDHRLRPAGKPRSTSRSRWYCCLGGGDATGAGRGREEGGRRRSTPSHPGIHLTFVAVPYDAAHRHAGRRSSPRATGRTSSVRSASAARTRSTASGSTCSRSSTKTNYDMTQFPPGDRRPLQGRRRGPGRASRSRSIPSVLFYKAEPVQGGRPQRAAARLERRATTRCPTAPTVALGLRHRHARSRKILTVDENGKDATDPASTPTKIVQ